MASNHIPQRNGRYLLEEMEGESFVFRPPAEQGIYLNETATVIWKLCDGTRSVQQIVDFLAEAYPDSAADILNDVSNTIDNFMRIGALKMVAPPRPHQRHRDRRHRYRRHGLEASTRDCRSGDQALRRHVLAIDDFGPPRSARFQGGAILTILSDMAPSRAPETEAGVTVLMPVRNGGCYLDAAIASILRQTFSDLEFIIVDDGSTDDTPKTLQRWQKTDARIRVLSGPQRGIAAALNQGLAEARGSTIVPWMPMMLPPRAHRMATRLPAGASGDRRGWICHPLYQCVGRTRPYIQIPANPQRTLAALQSGNSPVAHPAVAMRRDVILSLRGYRPLFDGAEDFDLWTRLTAHHQIANLPQVLLDYRIHKNRMTATYRWEQALAAYIARFSFRIRRDGLPDPTERAARLELSHLLKLNLESAERSSVLGDLTLVAFASFERRGASISLQQARDSLFALNDLSSSHMRQAGRTLIRYSWRASEYKQAIEVACWMAHRRLPDLFREGKQVIEIVHWNARRRLSNLIREGTQAIEIVRWNARRRLSNLALHGRQINQACQH